jgi:VWFA-related protein
MRIPTRFAVSLAAVLALAGAPGTPATEASAADPVLWPEAHRAFLQDGPGLLLSAQQRAELAALDEPGRADWIAGFLRDPDPSTPLDELAEGIERRRRLAAADFLSPVDVRARLIFLNGLPAERKVIECGLTFKPLEIWSYSGRPGGPGPADPQQLVVYRPSPDQPWRLWLPLDSKRVLYSSEMEYWMIQADELRGRLRGPRFDTATCDETRRVDQATGVRSLRDFDDERPLQKDYERFIEPPADLAAWARTAASTPLPEVPPPLAVESVRIAFPDLVNQRIIARAYLTLPAGSGVELETEGGVRELQLAVDGAVEQEGEIFEEFRVRFRQQREDDSTPIVLALDRSLRPDRAYLLRLRVSDEIGGAAGAVVAPFVVPREPRPEDAVPIADVISAMDVELGSAVLAGADTLILVPPPAEVVLGLWRAEALVTGSRIVQVRFLVDGEPSLTSARRPFSVELRLAEVPKEQVVRAEGYDAAGELVAADEVVINQTRGSLQVRIVEPERGWTGFGSVPVRVEVVVPEERRVAQVEIRLGDSPVVTLERPPWTATVEVPPPQAGEVTYLTVIARLDDGRSAEAVRFVNAPEYLEEVEVNLIELYTTVTDRSGRPVLGLAVEDFEVFEDGRRQEIVKFEQLGAVRAARPTAAENLPLTVGIAIDVSGSMVKTLGEAQAAGREFVARVVRPGDRCFVLGFSDRPELLMPPTDDPEACSEGLDDLSAYGGTALHDAVVTSLYYFRGFRGQRALILLSDGDDTASAVDYRAAAEYARRSGVAVYAVGLGVGVFGGVRGKLTELAEETGGRAFFVNRATELEAVYQEIEQELRSRYLLAYNSDRAGDGEGDAEFREVRVEMKPRGLEARTIRGYYP